MKRSDSLTDAWRKTLSRQGDTGAILDERGMVLRTFLQVEQRADEIANRLGQFQPGTVVAVQIGNDPDWPSVLLACLKRALIALPLDLSISEQDRAVALDICQASGLISTDSSNGTALPAVSVFERKPIDWGNDPPSLLKLTSGTTASPRAIRFRSDQLLADCVQICDSMGISDADLNFGVIPISHSYGFSNLLTPLLIRGVPLALSSDRLPRAIVRNLERSGATVFPGMPVFFQAFADMNDVPALPRLRLCISAGAPLSLNVAQRFRQKFGLTVHSFYGSSECGGICFDRDGTVLEEGFVGSAMEGVNLEVVDPDSAVTQIRVRSAAVGDGYFPDPMPEKLGGGVFTPDDLVTPAQNGWKIVGRVSDLINVAGKKVNPAEVEAELLAMPGIQEAVVFGRRSSRRNEEVAACIVASRDVSESEVLKSCRRRLSGWQVPKRIFLLDAIPINERGKVSRRELGLRFEGI